MAFTPASSIDEIAAREQRYRETNEKEVKMRILGFFSAFDNKGNTELYFRNILSASSQIQKFFDSQSININMVRIAAEYVENAKTDNYASEEFRRKFIDKIELDSFGKKEMAELESVLWLYKRMIKLGSDIESPKKLLDPLTDLLGSIKPYDIPRQVRALCIIQDAIFNSDSQLLFTESETGVLDIFSNELKRLSDYANKNVSNKKLTSQEKITNYNRFLSKIESSMLIFYNTMGPCINGAHVEDKHAEKCVEKLSFNLYNLWNSKKE